MTTVSSVQMLARITIGLVLLSLATAAPTKGQPLEALQGKHTVCQNNKYHTVEYDTVGVSSVKFVDLDGSIGSKLAAVTCDIDGTRLDLQARKSASSCLNSSLYQSPHTAWPRLRLVPACRLRRPRLSTLFNTLILTPSVLLLLVLRFKRS